MPLRLHRISRGIQTITKKTSNSEPYWELFKRKFDFSALPLNETSGTTAYDLTGNSRNGLYKGTYTLNNPGILPGWGSVYVNVGCVNWYSAAFAAAFNNTAGTVAVWAKPDPTIFTDTTMRNIFILNTTGGTSNGQIRAYRPASAGNEYYIRLETSEGATQQQTIFYDQDQANNWKLYAITWDQTTGKACHYVNGDLYGDYSSFVSFDGTMHSSLAAIGAGASSSYSYPWMGWLAFSGVASRALNGSEILTLHDTIFLTSRYLIIGDSKSNGDIWTYYLGKSLTTETGQTWKEIAPAFAVSGADTAGMHTYVDTNINRVYQTPLNIWINLGANDVSSLPTEATWKANMCGIIDPCLGRSGRE